LGPSEGKAFVLMESSRRAMLLQRPEGATVASEGLAIADELGLDGLRADLLNTLGICRLHEGDPGALADLEQSLERAKSLDMANAIQRAYNNLAEAHRKLGDFHQSSRYLEERRVYAERFAIPAGFAWLTGEAAIEAYYTGKWEDVRTYAGEMIAAAE